MLVLLDDVPERHLIVGIHLIVTVTLLIVALNCLFEELSIVGLRGSWYKLASIYRARSGLFGSTSSRVLLAHKSLRAV